MKRWIVELITNENLGHNLEIDAETIEKIDFQTIIIDGVTWTLPVVAGLSFAEVVEDRDDYVVTSW